MLDELILSDVEDAVRTAYEKGRQSVLAGLRSLAELNGSGPAVMKHFDPSRESVIAKGYVESQHPRDKNGHWINKQTIDTLAHSPEGRAQLHANVKPGDEQKLDYAIAAAQGEKAHGHPNVRIPNQSGSAPMSPKAEKMAGTVEVAQQLAAAVKDGTMKGDLPTMAKDLGRALQAMDPADFDSLKDHLGIAKGLGPEVVAGRMLNTAAPKPPPQPVKPAPHEDLLGDIFGPSVKDRIAAGESDPYAKPSPDASEPVTFKESQNNLTSESYLKAPSAKESPHYGPWSADDLREAAKPLRREMEESAHDPEAFLRAATEYGQWLKQFTPDELDGLAKAIGHDSPSPDVGHLASKLAAKALRRENPEAAGHTGVVHGEDGSRTHFVEGAVAAVHPPGEAKPEPTPAVPDATAAAVQAVPLTSSVDDIETHLRNPGPWARDTNAVKGRLAQRLTEPGQLEELATRVFGKNVADHLPKNEQRGHLLDKLAEFAKVAAEAKHGPVKAPPPDARQVAERLATAHDKQSQLAREEGPFKRDYKAQNNFSRFRAEHARQMEAHLQKHPELRAEFGKYTSIHDANPPPADESKRPANWVVRDAKGNPIPSAPSPDASVPVTGSEPSPTATINPPSESPAVVQDNPTPGPTEVYPDVMAKPKAPRRSSTKHTVSWQTPEGVTKQSWHGSEGEAREMKEVMERDANVKPGSVKVHDPIPPRPKADPMSLASIVRSHGHIDPQSHSFKTVFGNAKEAVEKGIPLNIFRTAAKGGRSLDDISNSLVNAGHIQPGDHEHAGEHLLNQLKAGALSAHADLTSGRYDKALEEFHRAEHEASLEHAAAEVAASARRGEESGRSEAQEDPFGNGDHGSVADGGTPPGGRQWRPRDRNKPLSDAEVAHFQSRSLVPPAEPAGGPSPDASEAVPPSGPTDLFGRTLPKTFAPNRGSQATIEDAYRENADRVPEPTTTGTAADLKPGEFGHTPTPAAKEPHEMTRSEYGMLRGNQAVAAKPDHAPAYREGQLQGQAEHRRAVSVALANGRYVSPDVLHQYRMGGVGYTPADSEQLYREGKQMIRAEEHVKDYAATRGAKFDPQPLAPHVANSYAVEQATRGMADPVRIYGYMNPHKDVLKRLGAKYVPEGRMWFLPKELVGQLPATLTVRPVRGSVESKSVAAMELTI